MKQNLLKTGILLSALLIISACSNTKDTPDGDDGQAIHTTEEISDKADEGKNQPTQPVLHYEKRKAMDRGMAPATGAGGIDGANISMAMECEDLKDSRYNPNFNTEEYEHIEENDFRMVGAAPLSTFSIDVDVASYSNTRRFLLDGQKPPADAVRIEEFVNYFDYDYPAPKGDDPFSINTELSDCPWNPKNKLLHIGIQGMEIDKSEMPVSNLVFLLDVSGSMASPDKLPLVQKAMRLLVNNLPVNNRIAIVVYAGASGTVLPSTPISEKEAILEAIEKLYAGGSTAGSEGIKLAYKVAKENFIDGGNNRVILATDGDFNVGMSSDGELVRLIEEKREDEIFLSVLGFGTGNIKDSKMEQLADKGNGNYAYIDNILEAQKVLVSEMGGTLVTIAKDVKIQVEFNPAEVKAYRLIGYENRLLNDEDFNDDTKDAGEIGAGATVTALYELVTDEEELKKVSKVDELKYQKTTPTDEASSSGELLTVKVRYKKPTGNTSKLLSMPVNTYSHVAFEDASADFRFATSVAAFGMLLRGSGHLGTASYEKVIAWAKDGRGSDDKGYRNEFIRLADLARSL